MEMWSKYACPSKSVWSGCRKTAMSRMRIEFNVQPLTPLKKEIGGQAIMLDREP